MQSHTSTIRNSCCTHNRKQTERGSANPWQSHAHLGHPVAIVLAMSDSVDNFEVAFQGDDHKAELTSGGTSSRQCCSFEDHANSPVQNGVAVVLVGTCKRQGTGAKAECACQKIHRRLIGNQSVNTAAKMSACTNQNCKDRSVSKATNAHDDQTTTGSQFGRRYLAEDRNLVGASLVSFTAARRPSVISQLELLPDAITVKYFNLIPWTVRCTNLLHE